VPVQICHNGSSSGKGRQAEKKKKMERKINIKRAGEEPERRAKEMAWVHRFVQGTCAGNWGMNPGGEEVIIVSREG